jgi:hypothetical protein
VLRAPAGATARPQAKWQIQAGSHGGRFARRWYLLRCLAGDERADDERRQESDDHRRCRDYEHHTQPNRLSPSTTDDTADRSSNLFSSSHLSRPPALVDVGTASTRIRRAKHSRLHPRTGFDQGILTYYIC